MNVNLHGGGTQFNKLTQLTVGAFTCTLSAKARDLAWNDKRRVLYQLRSCHQPSERIDLIQALLQGVQRLPQFISSAHSSINLASDVL